MKRSTLAILAAPTAALALTACGIAPEAAPSPPPSSSSSEVTSEPWTEEDEAAVEDPILDEPEPEDLEAKIGEPFTYVDGLTVTVDQLATFTPTEWSAGGESYPTHVKFRVTVDNNSGAPFDPSLAMSSVQSGTTEGDAVFDTDNGLDGSPSTSVLDGRSVSWVEGYGVQDASDLVVQVTPSWDHEAAIFTGGLQ